jgi:drug/metabolite transporter (DMT)-like permease
VRSDTKWPLALVGITMLWGWSFSATHKTLQHLGAMAFNAYGFLTAALCLLPLVLQRRPGLSRQQLVEAILPGLALFMAFALQTSGLRYTSASNTAFITGMAVVFTPLFAFLLLRQQPRRTQVAGAGLAFIGLKLLTGASISVNRGDLLVLGCAIFTALHIVLLSRISKKHDACILAFIQISVVALLSLLVAVCRGELAMPADNQAWSTILIVGILGTAIAYYVQTQAQAVSPPEKIALIIVLEPVFGGIFGYFLAGDQLGMVMLLGALLIISAMMVSESGIVGRRSPSRAKHRLYESRSQ